jgi:hypothetical protein
MTVASVLDRVVIILRRELGCDQQKTRFHYVKLGGAPKGSLPTEVYWKNGGVVATAGRWGFTFTPNMVTGRVIFRVLGERKNPDMRRTATQLANEIPELTLTIDEELVRVEAMDWDPPLHGVTREGDAAEAKKRGADDPYAGTKLELGKSPVPRKPRIKKAKPTGVVY